MNSYRILPLIVYATLKSTIVPAVMTSRSVGVTASQTSAIIVTSLATAISGPNGADTTMITAAENGAATTAATLNSIVSHSVHNEGSHVVSVTKLLKDGSEKASAVTKTIVTTAKIATFKKLSNSSASTKTIKPTKAHQKVIATMAHPTDRTTIAADLTTGANAKTDVPQVSIKLTSTAETRTTTKKKLTTTATSTPSTSTLTALPFTTTAAATTLKIRCDGIPSTEAPLEMGPEANATLAYCAQMLARINISSEVEFQAMTTPTDAERNWVHNNPDVWQYMKYAVEKFQVYTYPCGPIETTAQAVYDLNVFDPYSVLPETLGFGVDFESFQENYTDAYAAAQILGEALSVFTYGLLQQTIVSAKLFDCHMNDYIYTYLFEHDINCGLKIWVKQVWYRYRFKICLVDDKIYDKTDAAPVEKWRNVVDLVDFAAPLYILLNIFNLIILQKMHSGPDSAVRLIYVAEVLCDLLVIPISLQLQPTKFGQAMWALFNGGSCLSTSESKYENVYTLGENNMTKAAFEAAKTVCVDFSSFCLVVLVIDRFKALRNAEKYAEHRGRKRFIYVPMLALFFLFFTAVAFLSFLLAAFYATSDKTQNKSGLAYCAYEGFRFFYLISTATLIFVFSVLTIWKIVVVWSDRNADSYRHSAVLTLVCVFIKLPTIAYRVSWVAAQMCIAYGMYLQYVKNVPISDILWLDKCWTWNDELYYWQSVAYFKLVSLAMLVNLCCSGAYRRVLWCVIRCKTVPVDTVQAANASDNSINNFVVVQNDHLRNKIDSDDGKKPLSAVVVQDIEKINGETVKMFKA